MREEGIDSFKGFQLLRRKLRCALFEIVPEEIALCEFDCQKVNCTATEWKTCKRRIEKAAGELMPDA